MQQNKSIWDMIWMAPVVLVVIAIVFSTVGCYQRLSQRQAAVIDTGYQAAVLSLHQRTMVSSGCRYGLTLANNLTTEIRDLTLRFTAYGETGIVLQSVTRGFFGVKPMKRQFAEINFAFHCGQIKRIEVADFGRCMVGELTLRSAQPGRCLDLIDIPQSRLVEFVKAESN